MQKTLGGDRLGSGSKMKVDLHNYARSTHDLGYLWRSTMSAGTLVPFLSEVALPGDTFDINLNCDIKTHPTIGPLFGSYKVQLDLFLAPIRLYNSLLHNNALGIGLNMEKVKLPQLKWNVPTIAPIVEDLDNAQINPSCLLSYLGIRGGGYNDSGSSHYRYFNAVPYLAYWEIYKNYYANKQEEIGACIHTTQTPPITSVVDIYAINGPDSWEIPSTYEASILLTEGSIITVNFSGSEPKPEEIMVLTNTMGWVSLASISQSYVHDVTDITSVYNDVAFGNIYVSKWRYINASDVRQGEPEVYTFPLSNIDDMRKHILAYDSEVTPFYIDASREAPYNLPLTATWYESSLNSQEALGLKTYQSDLFNNWIQTEWIDGTNGINAITAIDTSGGSFNIDTFLLSKKVYDMLNRIAVSGGTYDDWLDAVYVHDRYTRCESPMYMGGLIKELVFQEVVSNSQSTDQPLGTLAGKGVMSKKHKGGHATIKVDEPSYIIGIISLTPRLDYSQGNKWDVHLETMDDLHKPALDEIGFQELITEQMAWWDTKWDAVNNVWVQKSAGKQPAWLNYMTNVNQVRGNFAIADNEMFMTLNRRYEKDNDGIKDLTTYIDPSKFNFIFAETAIDAQNFWAQIAVDITARRKLSAKVMPNL